MWWWILAWAVLFLAAGVVLALLVWHIIRRLIALGRELARSADELSGATTPVPRSHLAHDA